MAPIASIAHHQVIVGAVFGVFLHGVGVEQIPEQGAHVVLRERGAEPLMVGPVMLCR
jgi:hypothetical protein